MKKPFFLIFLILFLFIGTPSCSLRNNEEEQVLEVVDSFAIRYLSWHFPDAIQYTDESGERFLRYLSSNVHDGDLDEIRKQREQPGYSVFDLRIHEDSAKAIVKMSNVILMDTIGDRAHHYEKAIKEVELRKHNGIWLIHKISSVH